MGSTGFLDLPAEIRNTIYHLVLCEYRINLTRQKDIPDSQPATLTIHGMSLALQSVCKTLRKETSEIVPIPVVSMSNCLSSYMRTIRVPQSYLHRTRKLVIDSYVALDTDLSWSVSSMPHLLEVEVYLSIDSSHLTGTTISFAGVPDVLDLRGCSYDVENISKDTQIDVPNGELLANLKSIRDAWMCIIGKWSTEPKIIVRRQRAYYKRLGDGRRSAVEYECICVTELAFSIFPIRLTSLKKARSAAEGVNFFDLDEVEALVEPLWDFDKAEFGPNRNC